MRNYVIINGVNSLTKNGLAIRDLPPITKTMMRTLREEIDGRDGDIITELGYSAYDKSMTIGLFGTGYDIDDIIAFFNQSGTIVFSNEPDKFYNFKIIEQIDYNKLLKFKEATIRFHCQPFKYPLNEVPLEEEYQYVEATGTDITLDNTSENIFNKFDLFGNIEQKQYSGIQLLDFSLLPLTKDGLTISQNENGDIVINGTPTIASGYTTFRIGSEKTIEAGTYSVSVKEKKVGIGFSIGGFNGSLNLTLADTTRSKTQTSTQAYYIQPDVNIRYDVGTLNNFVLNPLLQTGSTIGTFEPYVGGIPSPSPEYPQDIHVVSGDNTIDICGENLFKGYENMTNGFLPASGNYPITNSSYPNARYQLIELKAGESLSTGNSSNAQGRLRCIDKETNQVVGTVAGNSTYYNSTTYYGGGFATGKITALKDIIVGVMLLQNITQDKDFMIVRGDTLPSTYEPYIGNSYPIYLGVENLIDLSTITYNTNSNKVSISISGDTITQTNATSYARGTYYLTNLQIGKSYTFSSDFTNPNSCSLRLDIYNSTDSGTVIVQSPTTTETSGNISVTFTATETTHALRIYTNTTGTANTYSVVFNEVHLVEGNNHISSTPIEMASIPNTDYKDTFVKIDDVWYVKKMTEKINITSDLTWFKSSTTSVDKYYTRVGDWDPTLNKFSYCTRFKYKNGGVNIGEFDYSQNGNYLALFFCYAAYNTSTINSFKTWLDNNEVYCLVPISTPIYIEITDTILTEQLEAIKNAVSREDQTNVTQTNNDLPFVLDLSALELNSDHLVINNIGNIYAKPTLDLEGTGIVDIYLNDIQMFEVDLTENNEIIINTDEMEAFNPETGALANRLVTGEYDVFKLESGENDLRFSGNLTKATITNYERWL